MKLKAEKTGILLFGGMAALIMLHPALSDAAGTDQTPLSVREVRHGGDSFWEVENSHYRVLISPGHGAAITSFRLKPTDTECTYSGTGDFSGILQDVHTAELPYRMTERIVAGKRKQVLVFAASAGTYRVEKEMTFLADSPFVNVRMTFENHSPRAMRGDRAPALSSVFRIGDYPRPDRHISFTGGQRGTDVYTAHRLHRTLHPLAESLTASVPWLAVIDPAEQAGIGMLFFDAGVDGLSAVRNSAGFSGIETRFRPLPPGSRLRTEFALVPLQGFFAVDLITPHLAAKTARIKHAETEALSVRIKSLAAEIQDISVVTRAYDSRGRELRPLETIVMGRTGPGEAGSGTIMLPDKTAGDAAWIRHEIYSEGRRLAQYLVRMSDYDIPPAVRPWALPEPDMKLLEKKVASGPRVNENINRQAVSLSRLAQAGWQEVDSLDVSMAKNSVHTLLFRVEAKDALRDLHVGVAGAPDRSDGRSGALTASNVFVWEIADSDSSEAVIRPFRQQHSIEKNDAFFFAVTIDGAALEDRTYAASILVTTADETVEVPLTLRVYPVEPARQEGFALWIICNDIAAAMETGKTCFRSVSGISVGLFDKVDQHELQSLLNSPAAEKEIFGFYSPGMASVKGEKISQWELAADRKTPGPGLTWLLCSGADSIGEAPIMEKFGFIAAAFVLRASPAIFAALQDAEDIRHIVSGGDMRHSPDGGRPHFWRYVDLRSHNWAESGVHLRQEFFSALINGARGAAVHIEPGSLSGNERMLLWYILNDIREETALLALALNSAHDPDVPVQLRKKLKELVSDKDVSAPMTAVTERGAFGETTRIRFNTEEHRDIIPQMRRIALEILTETGRGRSSPAAPPHHQPLWSGSK